jgi:nitrite reductase (NADH) large subunit
MAVSGCVRECAEAQCKDVGLVATDNGYNLYVCGNGGATPRHADLFVADIDEETAILYIDRLLMYYISTADKLTRTSVWLEKLEGGLDHLRDVIIEDSLGLCDELEAQMQHLIDNYQCEWTRVVNDPAQRARFRQFVNTEEEEPVIEFVSQRDQSRPADWNDELTSLELFGELKEREEKFLNGDGTDLMEQTRWVQVGTVDNFPQDGGATIKYGKSQIAVFNFTSRGEWYSSQNMCPHKKAFVLSRGIVGDQSGTPKVACPLHKKTFSLETGESLQGEDYDIRTFPVKVEGGNVFLELPPTEILDELLATEIGCSMATSCQSKCEPVAV